MTEKKSEKILLINSKKELVEYPYEDFIRKPLHEIAKELGFESTTLFMLYQLLLPILKAELELYQKLKKIAESEK